MAQKVQVLLIDDINGGEANETVTFGLDGKSFEIDLSTKNGQKLRNLLSPYVTAGRKVGGRTANNRPRTAGASKGNDSASIRAWAKEQGYSINDRGRVSAEIREAYAKAQAA
ncbi:Lsr2 family protein [Streptomyces xanthochromogenes]|uniref:histone-like nucleoid-structuring protein Lsr2 n=1 Tax=Streptomyces xanthochromogenes TaxID=67384 RepID=UPI001677F03B|nr:Lsr2 family protein [Streptomyces xanthochromogenes]GHB51903.1 Lsr2 family protein [Streptomyces xanthochromogenes]